MKTPKTENIHEHNRSGKAGDFRIKLKPDTIDWLDDFLRPNCILWDTIHKKLCGDE